MISETRRPTQLQTNRGYDALAWHILGMSPSPTFPTTKALALGKRIGDARRRLELSQDVIARQLGVSKGAVGQYEIGYTSPRLPKLHKLAEILGVTVEWLLTGDDPDEKVKAQTVAEQEALQLMRAIPAEQQDAALAMLKALGMVRTKK